MSLNHLVKEITKSPVWQDLIKALATESTFKIAAPYSIYSLLLIILFIIQIQLF